MQNTTLNGFTLHRLLGKGGMAEVWYAENRLGKPAAVKIMLPRFKDEEQVVKRFETEAKALVKLDHPNIRQVMDYGDFNGLPFIIMEYLSGKDMGAFLESGQNPSGDVVLAWFNQCLLALIHSHQNGVIHRDIKPSNIFICDNGKVKLLDFGIAKVKDEISLTQTGQGMGTLLYMSPEQIVDVKRVTPATDVYSLAVSFVHLLRGKIPFGDTCSNFRIQEQIVKGQIDLSGIDKPWEDRLLPCLHTNPEKRPGADDVILSVNLSETFNQTNDRTVVLSPENHENDKTVISTDLNQEKSDLFAFRDSSTGKLGYADISGMIIIKPEFDEAISFFEGLAAVKKDDKYGYIDLKGKLKIPFLFDGASIFQEGVSSVKLDEKEGFIDPDGNIIIPAIYDGVSLMNEGMIRIELNEKFGFIDKSGKSITPIIYDEAEDFSEGLALVRLNQKGGFIDRHGKTEIPFAYGRSFSFSEGLSPVMENGKMGFMDKSGNLAIPCKFEDAYGFQDGISTVRLNGKWGYINKKGEMFIPERYDFAGYFHEGLAAVKLNGKWGYTDMNGDMVIPAKYDNTMMFTEGLAFVEKDLKYGFIDKSGNEVIPLVYDCAFIFYKGLAVVESGSRKYYINKRNEYVFDAPN